MNLSLFKGELTATQSEAIELHFEIKKNGELAAVALVEFCKGLKKMRDSRLYCEFGYETFEEYAEKEFSLKQRQAYNYIQALEGLGETVLQSNANLGITKLKILSEIPRLESENFLENNDVDNMTARELKEAIEKLKAKEEQISFLTMENSELNKNKEELEKDIEESVKIEKERDSLKEQLEDASDEISLLKAELKELTDKPQQVAVREPTEEEIKKAADPLIAKEKERAVKDAESKAQKQIEEMENKYKSVLMTAEQEKMQATAKLDALEKKAKVSANPDVLKFSFYFEECQKNITKMKEIVSSVDKETADKLIKAMAAVAEKLKEVQTNA